MVDNIKIAVRKKLWRVLSGYVRLKSGTDCCLWWTQYLKNPLVECSHGNNLYCWKRDFYGNRRFINLFTRYTTRLTSESTISVIPKKSLKSRVGLTCHLSAARDSLKLKEHHLSAVCNCLFSIFNSFISRIRVERETLLANLFCSMASGQDKTFRP